MTDDTSGFYKKENNELFYGKNFVYGINFTNLLRETKDQYTYPFEGWYWFDSETEARQFLNIPKMENNFYLLSKPKDPYPYSE